jgi:hypothetical protein
MKNRIYSSELDVLLEKINEIINSIKNSYDNILEELIFKDYKLRYDANSFKEVIKRKKDLFNKLSSEVSEKNYNNLEEILKRINNVDYNEMNNIKKIERFNDEFPLFIEINNIINDNNLSDRDKQMAIESLSLNYDIE